MRTYTFLLFVAGITSYLLTRWFAGRASERGWARRKEDTSNGEGVPRLGGVAVYAATLAAIALLLLWDNQVADRLAHQLPQALALLGAGSAVFLLGLFDDLHGARPWQKLAAQVLGGSALWVAGFRVELLTNPFTNTTVALGWLSLPLTLLWVVAISNAFNLIDGLDGLAAGVGLFSTLTLFLLAMLAGRSFIAAITAALAGALIGFLPHNFPPARIYLGDSGSLTIGLALAALAIEGAQKGPVLITISIPVVIFGLPLLDAGVTTLRRFLAGHSIFQRDEEHIHHRLLKLGLPRHVAVLVLYTVAGVFALASLLLLNYRGAVAPLIAVLCGALAWLVIRQMQYPEFAELDSHLRQALGSQRAVLRNQILLRKAAAEIRQAAATSDAWEMAGRVFQALEFDRAECEVNGSLRLRWATKTDDRIVELVPNRRSWQLSVPLDEENPTAGTLHLMRSLDRGPLKFRVSSLLEFTTHALGPRLLGLVEQEQAEPLIDAEQSAELTSPL